MRIGILTGGGDCPGLNAVIRAVVRRGIRESGHSFWGYRHGWRGVVNQDGFDLVTNSVSGILVKGGTILGTSRTNPLKDHSAEEVLGHMSDAGIDALIAIGGEDTLGVAAKLAHAGGHIVGVPKTIDNDLSGTEVTFGFNTAVQIATDALDRLHTTAESHDRVMVCEMMGRHAGWIALESGIAGGADAILIPEIPFDIEEVCGYIRSRHARGRNFSIVVVAEGAMPKEGTMTLTEAGTTDEFGHVRLGGIGNNLAVEVEERTGYETRVTILGHVQRGGTPTAFDRVLATRFGIGAIHAVDQGAWGKMVALRCGEIVRVPLDEATGTLKTVDPALYDVGRTFFG